MSQILPEVVVSAEISTVKHTEISFLTVLTVEAGQSLAGGIGGRLKHGLQSEGCALP